MEETVKERIKLFIAYKGIGQARFEKAVGFSNGYINNLKKAPTAEKLQKILNTYPELNEKWLLSGEGHMLKAPANKTNTGQTTPTVSPIPLIPISAMAGFGKENPTTLEYEGERYIIPAFKEAEFLIQVKGSSMYPNYSNGDVVACKKLPLDTFFQWNRVYVLDTEQGALIKRVKDSGKEDTLLIVSDNPDYEPFELHRKHIKSIALVVGVVHIE